MFIPRVKKFRSKPCRRPLAALRHCCECSPACLAASRFHCTSKVSIKTHFHFLRNKQSNRVVTKLQLFTIIETFDRSFFPCPRCPQISDINNDLTYLASPSQGAMQFKYLEDLMKVVHQGEVNQSRFVNCEGGRRGAS